MKENNKLSNFNYLFSRECKTQNQEFSKEYKVCTEFLRIILTETAKNTISYIFIKQN